MSGGTTIKRGSAIPAAGTQQASHAACSREIKKHVNIPVATVGRIDVYKRQRENSRNGYRPRSLKTAVGDVELEIPKLRHGTYYPEGMQIGRASCRERV